MGERAKLLKHAWSFSLLKNKKKDTNVGDILPTGL